MSEHIWEAHGVLGCVAWAILAPIGALTIRIVPSTKAWIIHGGIMLLALLAFTSNVGIGLYRVLHLGADVSPRVFSQYIVSDLSYRSVNRHTS